MKSQILKAALCLEKDKKFLKKIIVNENLALAVA